MTETLHILLVEDALLDAELTLAKLTDAGMSVDAVRVETEAAFREQLKLPDLDLILSDFSLPDFTGLAALQIARHSRPDLPFIFVSGALGEDTAVEMLKEGATDYVLKQRLDRLVPAVRRAVSEYRERARRRRVEEELRDERRRAEAEREALLANERAARNEAERASKMKDEFLATLSHELRTPLNAIVGWTQILRNGKCSDEDLDEGLAVIERNARAQSRIIEDLLDMSRIISGKLRLDLRPIDLHEAVTAGLESVRPAAEAKGIAVHKTLECCPPVRGDAGRLQQVMWNLLSNAVKFTPRGGRIDVRLATVDDHAEISVHDTGIGIKPEFLPHVFDRFRQADASTTRHHGGLGLGLAIVKQLVEIHGGHIRAQSQGEGGGAAFTITLPLASSAHAPHNASNDGHGDPQEDRQIAHCPPAPASLIRPKSRLNGIRILVVDDEPDSRLLARRILEDCGATVITADSVDASLSLLRSERFDILVSDIGMPDRDGCELVRTLRAFPPDQGGVLPAVALTAFARSEDRRRAMDAGFDMYVHKPVDPDDLCNCIARLAGPVQA